jgi:hypothetical protein
MSIADFWSWLGDPLRAASYASLADPVRLHGLLMAFAAGLLMPLAVLLTRYFKILPSQDWPRDLNRRFWWVSHLALAYSASVAAAAALVLVFMARPQDANHVAHAHAWIGWLSMAMMLALVINGWQRGSTGGPGKPAPGTFGPLHGVAGDHYDMTARRRWFERTHKLLGYLLLAVLFAGVLSGLWQASAPRWALLLLAAWWVTLLLLALRWERQGRCVDGYQAAWGPSMAHPGNRIPELGWGSRRYSEEEFHRLPWVSKRSKMGKPPPAV